MEKSGQGISLNTIIIAAIALLVLVVLALIFMGRISIFDDETVSCQNNGGICVASQTDCELEDGTIKTGENWKCQENEYCCLPIS